MEKSTSMRWVVGIDPTSADNGSKVLFIPYTLPDNPLSAELPHQIVERCGGFTVNLHSGEVNVDYRVTTGYVIPKEYKLTVLTYLPEVISAEDVSRLLPKLRLIKHLRPSLGNAGMALA